MLIHGACFVVIQALGMKLLRKKDVPDYTVPSITWSIKNVAKFHSDERMACNFSLRCGVLSIFD